MPASTEHTLLESLILFQLLEHHGTEPEAFETISDILLHSQHILEAEGADPRRLTPDSIKQTFDYLLAQEIASAEDLASDGGINGAVAGAGEGLHQYNKSQSPRKRRLGSRSPTPARGAEDIAQYISQIVERLYARYRDAIIEELRQDELRIQALQEDLRQLEVQEDDVYQPFQPQDQHPDRWNDGRGQSALGHAQNHQPGSNHDREAVYQGINEPNFPQSKLQSGLLLETGAVKPAIPDSQQPSFATPPPSRTYHDPTQASHQLSNPPTSTQTPQSFDEKIQREPKTGDAPRNFYPPPSTSSDPSHFPPISTAPLSGQKLDKQNAPENNLPGLPATAQSYTSPYQPGGLTAGNQSTQRPAIEKPLTSIPPHIRPEGSQYPSYSPAGSPRTPTGLPTPGESHFDPKRPSLTVSTSSTKWKFSPINVPESARGSPEPGDVSPISDDGLPSSIFSATPSQQAPRKSKNRLFPESSSKYQGRSERHTAVDPKRGTRGIRKSVGERTPSQAFASSRDTTRSQSVVSYGDDHPPEVEHAVRRVKREEPATPRFQSSGDTERERTGTTEEGSYPANRSAKNTRGSGFEATNKVDSATITAELPDPNVISTTKNFSKTTAPIWQMITGHRFASLFSVPVKEKDAPGYHSTIYRPQDLKSIKAAITSGNRAVLALQGGLKDHIDSPISGPATPSKNNDVVLQATPDIIPPKGIVNSAQLEKEVMRMFANAVMFNPDPHRGFGPTFSDQSGKDDDDDEEADKQQSHYAEVDGGVVTDTREMFEAVAGQLSIWRRSLNPKMDGGDRTMLDSEVAEDETEYMMSTGDRESTADEGGPGPVKRRRRG